MNELTKIFEDQEVKVVTNKGKVLINLVNTARVCGLTTVAKSGNAVIRWNRVAEKLNLILKSLRNESTLILQLEINQVLYDIENIDDRNAIYMSTWLSKRLATECHSEKAGRYKNYLVTLDENRDTLQLTVKSEEVSNLVTNTLQNIMPTIATEIAKQFAPMVTETKNQVNNMSKLIYDQSAIYDQDRTELKQLIGFRNCQVKWLTEKLKEKLSSIYQCKIMASNRMYINAKQKIFKQYKTTTWEEIPASKYNEIDAFIDSLEKEDLQS